MNLTECLPVFPQQRTFDGRARGESDIPMRIEHQAMLVRRRAHPTAGLLSEQFDVARTVRFTGMSGSDYRLSVLPRSANRRHRPAIRSPRRLARGAWAGCRG